MANIAAIGGDDFLIHATRVRSEIRDKFLKAHKVLEDREADLLAKLKELEDEFIGDVIIKQIEELNLSKSALINTLKINNNKDVLDQNLTTTDTRIDELKKRFQTAKDTYRSVALEWDVELEDKLSLTGDVLLNCVTQEQVRDYKMIHMPVATFGKHSEYVSSSPGVFHYPTGLTIDPTTNHLYICDGINNHVQVFDKSFEFLSQFSDKMDGPFGICIKRNKIYVTQFGSSLLTVYSIDGKYLQSVGGKRTNHLEFDRPFGLDISVDLNRIYIADSGNHRIHCLNLDLSFLSNICDIFEAVDVKLTPEEVVVLSSCNPCISLYSYSHQLIREMIPCGDSFRLKSNFRFILDKAFNILITDDNSHCVCVYSYRGEFIHSFGKEGDQEGEFIEPCGIIICPQGRIIVTSDNPNHPIQIFS